MFVCCYLSVVATLYKKKTCEHRFVMYVHVMKSWSCNTSGKERERLFFPKESAGTHEESLSNDAQHVSTVFAEREHFFFYSEAKLK